MELDLTLCLHSCSIGRLIAGTGSTEDLNLNGDYYIIYGRRTRDPAPGMLRTHFGVSPNPSVSSTLSNPAPPRVGIPEGVSMPVCITGSQDNSCRFQSPSLSTNFPALWHFHRALHPVTFLWSSETRRIVMSVTATYTLA